LEYFKLPYSKKEWKALSFVYLLSIHQKTALLSLRYKNTAVAQRYALPGATALLETVWWILILTSSFSTMYTIKVATQLCVTIRTS
jgi:hypothetical protein